MQACCLVCGLPALAAAVREGCDVSACIMSVRASSTS